MQGLLERGVDVAVFARHEGGGIPPVLLQLRDQFGKDRSVFVWQATLDGGLTQARRRLQVVVGKMDDDADVDRTVESSDFVVACIGHAAAKPEQGVEFEATFKAILDSMQRNGSKRLVMVSSANASEKVYEAGADVLSNIARNMQWAGK